MKDTMAMNAIHGIMSGQEWDGETLDAIKLIVQATGRDIENSDDLLPDFSDAPDDDAPNGRCPACGEPVDLEARCQDMGCGRYGLAAPPFMTSP